MGNLGRDATDTHTHTQFQHISNKSYAESVLSNEETKIKNHKKKPIEINEL